MCNLFASYYVVSYLGHMGVTKVFLVVVSALVLHFLVLSDMVMSHLRGGRSVEYIEYFPKTR